MRVLFLTHRLPYAPNRGDRIRAYHMLRTLLASGIDVDLVSLVHDAAEEACASHLHVPGCTVRTVRCPRLRNLARGAVLLPTRVPLTHSLLDAPGLRTTVADVAARSRPDVVLAYCSGIAPAAFAPSLAGVPLVLDLVDVDSAKWMAYARDSRWPMRWVYAREARCLGRFEEAAARHAFATLVVNARERALVADRVSDGDIRVISVGVDIEGYRPRSAPSHSPRVVFCGVFNYRPNERGALWFAERVWPLVGARHPNATLTLVGADPTRAVRSLARRDPSIEVTGRVRDVRPYLWQSAVSIAPLAEARGLQNKVLEAAGAGLPSVITRVVADGLPDAVLPACTIADAEQPFADAVVRLLDQSPESRRRIANRADLSHLGWADQLAALVPLLREAAAHGRIVRAPRCAAS